MEPREVQLWAALTCGLVVALGSIVALLVTRPAAGAAQTRLDSWALDGRRYGGLLLWCLLGGTIYTAYTVTAIPGVVFASGAIGFYAVPYTIVVYGLAFLLAPRLAAIARVHGYITIADFVRARYGSSGLTLAVALTGVLAIMPYLALQLVGIRAVLTALGIHPSAAVGDMLMVALFGVLAFSTYRAGIRASAWVAVVKAILLVLTAIVLTHLVVRSFGSVEAIYSQAEARSAAGGPDLALAEQHAVAYATLAFGSALALFTFPHVLTVVFTGRTSDVVRRTALTLLAWTALLCLFAALGLAAVAARVQVPAGRAELAVPMLITALAPEIVAGLVLGALVVAALVPAAVMSIGAATLFARNIFVEFMLPDASAEAELQVARIASLVIKVGALVFALALANNVAVNLHLLAAVWVLQTFPAVLLGMFRKAPHSRAVLTGWAVGMATGTGLVTADNFSPLVSVPVGESGTQVYVAVVALLINLATVAVIQVLAKLRRWPRGLERSHVVTTRDQP